MRGHERSQERISDGQIAQFLRDSDGEITLIAMDHNPAEYCKNDNICIKPAKCGAYRMSKFNLAIDNPK